MPVRQRICCCTIKAEAEAKVQEKVKKEFKYEVEVETETKHNFLLGNCICHGACHLFPSHTKLPKRFWPTKASSMKNWFSSNIYVCLLLQTIVWTQLVAGSGITLTRAPFRCYIQSKTPCTRRATLVDLWTFRKGRSCHVIVPSYAPNWLWRNQCEFASYANIFHLSIQTKYRGTPKNPSIL